jgi:hypothetical protein
MSHFTWSKNIDYDGTYYNQDAKLAGGPASNNREQVFFIATLYELTFGKSHRFMSDAAKPLDLMFGGWQVNGTYSWMSGQPFTPSYRIAMQIVIRDGAAQIWLVIPSSMIRASLAGLSPLTRR